jgi:hypothetical protein
MLALSDQALALLAIRCTGIPPHARSRFMQDIARQLDPPAPQKTVSPSASQQARYGALRRRRADTRRWRERQARGAACYFVEVDGETFDLLIRFGGLDAGKANDRREVAQALGKLLRRALSALLREAARS